VGFNFSRVCDAGCTGTATDVLTLVDFYDDDSPLRGAAGNTPAASKAR
jgi:hypothetical protein